MNDVELIDAVRSKFNKFVGKCDTIESKIDAIKKEMRQKIETHQQWMEAKQKECEELEAELRSVRRDRDELYSGLGILKKMKLRKDQGKEEV